MTSQLNFNTPRRPAAWVGAGVLALLLTACGGGSYEAALPETPAGTVPASATASPRAYTLFVGSLAATEHAVPLILSEAETPTTETGEPLVVN